jgi:CubicO group peptidase (beta-lactamase class C family)
MDDGIGGMAVPNGKILLQWGKVDRRGIVESIRKSMLGALIGIYADEGKIDLQASLAQLGIDDREPRLTEVERGAKVVDLLQCRSGVYHPAAWEDGYMKAERPARGSHPPGTARDHGWLRLSVVGV